jgi:hypothetical protein
LKALIFAAGAFLFGLLTALPAPAADPGRIDADVTPFYDSSGPVINIGKYSTGLGSKTPGEFVSTIFRMKNQWNDLNFIELYVGAIRLYDLGYRNEATYWFYTAQYRGRLFALLVDQKRLGSIGDRGFELYHAQQAFFELVGPNINGYAFGDMDFVVAVIYRVQNESKVVPNMQTMYPGVSFLHRSQWQGINADLNSGLGKLAAQLKSQRNEIKQQRIQNGTQAQFAHLTSRRFPGGL